MDPKTKIPEIKPEVNREKKKERKGGIFARLFGAAEGGASLGGGAIDITGAAAGGGLLATKAGLIALILAGSTVAAGIGLVGYRMFGPGQDDNSENNITLFASKPKAAADAAAGAAGDKDGTSKSLNMLNSANSDASSAQAPAATADAAPKDATAADASAASSGGASGPINGTADGGAGAAKTIASSKMAPLAGFGSGGGSPSGGAGATSSVAQPKLDANAGAKGGSLTGSGAKSGAARTASATPHAGRSNGALGQAFGSLGDQAGGRAASSYSAGRTYDGSATTGASAIGPQAGAIGGGNGTDGTSQTAAKSTPNTANPANKFQAVPTPAATNATPWQGDINAARAMIVVALVLGMFKRKLANMLATPGPTGIAAHTIARVIDAILVSIGVAIIAMGARVAGGEFGQVTQGEILAAAGAGVIAMSAKDLFAGDAVGETGATEGTPASGSTPATPGTAATFSNTSPLAEGGVGAALVVIGGGLAAVGLLTSMVQPLKTYPSSDFNNGLAPGQGWFSMGRMPSQDDVVRRLS